MSFISKLDICGFFIFIHLLFISPAFTYGVLRPRTDPTGGMGYIQKLPEVGIVLNKTRLFVMTDILNEPDDSMSLVRYLLYSNLFDTRGIVAVTSQSMPNATHPEEIKRIIRVYGEVIDNLNAHVPASAKYTPAEDLISLVSSGPTVYGKEALRANSSLSDGAKLLIQRLEESEEPLWVTAWGGTNCLAQALKYIRETKRADQADSLFSRIRLYTISDQDDTTDWIRYQFPQLFFIGSIHGWRSYASSTWSAITVDYSPAVDYSVVEQPWLTQNIQSRGLLGKAYPNILYGMEGDSPSFLYLIPNGLGWTERPDWGSWGGRFGLISFEEPRWANTRDNGVIGEDGLVYGSDQATLWRWRRTFQYDFASRLLWSTTSNFSAVGHPPVIRINGSEGPAPLVLPVKYNQGLMLDASATVDQDHPDDNSGLEFQWYQYLESTLWYDGPSYALSVFEKKPLAPPSGTNGTLPHNDVGFTDIVTGNKVEVVIPPRPTTIPETPDLHLILQVRTKSGEYPSTRYKRIVFMPSE